MKRKLTLRIETSQETLFKDVESFFALQVVVQLKSVSELILFLAFIQLRDDGRMRLKTVLTDGEHYFYHVLHALIYVSLVKHVAERLEYRLHSSVSFEEGGD